MRKIFFSALAALLTACSALPVPQDQAQTVYALEGAYQAAATVETKYIQSPSADAGAVSAIKKADQTAYDALTAAQTAVQSGAGSAAVAAAVATAQDALAALTSLLHTKGLI